MGDIHFANWTPSTPVSINYTYEHEKLLTQWIPEQSRLLQNGLFISGTNTEELLTLLKDYIGINRQCWTRPRVQTVTYTIQWRHNGRESVSNHQPHDCLLNRLFRRRSKRTSKLRVTGLCAGNSPVTGEFPAQRASNAENVSIWWRHHVYGRCWLLHCNATGVPFEIYDWILNRTVDISDTLYIDFRSSPDHCTKVLFNGLDFIIIWLFCTEDSFTNWHQDYISLHLDSVIFRVYVIFLILQFAFLAVSYHLTFTGYTGHALTDKYRIQCAPDISRCIF